MAETVLITGASSGIGLELARSFAADRSDLILVARSEGKLKDLSRELESSRGIRCLVMPADLADPKAPESLLERLRAADIVVDVLVNNAGFGAIGPVASLDARRQVEMIQVNVSALTHLTRLLVPSMIERRKGGILNVASTAAFQPGPNMAVYYATKAFVLSFSEALAEEVAGSGVRVTCLCPGPTKTGFVDAAGMEGVRLFRLGAMDAPAVARFGHSAYRQGRVVAIPGLVNKVIPQSLRVSPRFLVRKIAKRLNVVDAHA